QQDPRPSETADSTGSGDGPASDDALGPALPVADPGRLDAEPASRPAGAGALSESQQVIHRRAAPQGVVHRSSEQQAVQHPVAGMGGWPLWDALPLTVVLVLIAGIALVVKKYLPAKRMFAGAGVLDVVARLPLSGKQSLMLVKMGRRLVLLGVSGERISSLDVVQDPDQVAAILGQAASGRPDSITRAFDEALGDEVGAYVEPGDGPAASTAAGGAVRGLLEKVRRLTQRQEMA
ncbi:MAG TPA: flagellar biosynthetic protein FliO, partial [Phycisphaerae bacterium]|nr:flagellar biosynthetic protein FliO [Phycisphaerae bacterium]